LIERITESYLLRITGEKKLVESYPLKAILAAKKAESCERVMSVAQRVTSIAQKYIGCPAKNFFSFGLNQNKP
jgi:hypothetical protein